jgi:hypothetical protein
MMVLTKPVEENASPMMMGAVVPSALATSEVGGSFVIASWAEQDEFLRNLWLAGESPPQIADKLGRSVAAIMTRAARLGLPRRFAPGRKPTGRRSFLPVQKTALAASGGLHSKLLPSETTTRPLTERVCLMCLTKFPSQGAHNRICSSCKDSNDYHAGARLPDLDFPT